MRRSEFEKVPRSPSPGSDPHSKFYVPIQQSELLYSYWRMYQLTVVFIPLCTCRNLVAYDKCVRTTRSTSRKTVGTNSNGMRRLSENDWRYYEKETRRTGDHPACVGWMTDEESPFPVRLSPITATYE
jgi:hypothetical protein